MKGRVDVGGDVGESPAPRGLGGQLGYPTLTSPPA